MVAERSVYLRRFMAT